MDNENKVTINWYPGHMEKARRQMEEQLKLVDIIIEIRDARMPLASGNPLLDEMASNKERLIILNKADKADSKQNELWINGFKNVVLCDSLNEKNTKKVVDKVKLILKAKLDKARERGIRKKVLRAMVVGIPNVGKSTFINNVVKKKVAKAENRPGVTKNLQWIRINEDVELLDTPGVLWPKFENKKIALNLAFTGTIKDEILDNLEIAYELLKFLLENYKENLIQTYKITEGDIDELLNNENQAENENIMDVMRLIGRKRGAIISGGNIDENKTANILIKDFRDAKIGRITLETI